MSVVWTFILLHSFFSSWHHDLCERFAGVRLWSSVPWSSTRDSARTKLFMEGGCDHDLMALYVRSIGNMEAALWI